MIIASGKYPRPLNVPGEQRLLGKGVAYCATGDAPFYQDKVVAVVGGGNSALEAAGDVTNVRDKQVIVAAGEGSKAALRAHEYLLTQR